MHCNHKIAFVKNLIKNAHLENPNNDEIKLKVTSALLLLH